MRPLLVSWLFQFHDHASADCEPAACGNLTLRYPFWLGSSTSSQPPSPCGNPGFEVWCGDDVRVASLKGSSIHVLGIDYTTDSFVASHAKLAGDDGVCKIDFNVSSSIPLSLFNINPQNRALCFLYNCSGTAPSGPEYANATANCSSTPSYAYLGGDYYWGRPPAPIATWRCQNAYMPVLGSEAAVMTAANYNRLLKDGFVLDWEVAGVGDCRTCKASGRQCRYDSAATEFWCLCPDGRRAARPTCAGESHQSTMLPHLPMPSVHVCASIYSSQRVCVDAGGRRGLGTYVLVVLAARLSY